MRTPQLVPSWLKLQDPITKYAQDAMTGYWWDITKSGLTTPERALAASLRWRWHALNSQSDCAQQSLGGEDGRANTRRRSQGLHDKPNKESQVQKDRQMLGKKPFLRLSAIVGLTLVYGWMLMIEIVSIREVGIIYLMAGVGAAYVEYRRRKMVAKYQKLTDTKLASQARRFHGELWKIIHFKPLGVDSLENLMELQAEFRQIHPSSRYDSTDLSGVLIKENENRKAATLNER